ncbi:unnamed protein product, partial [Medioppia subpectinata]
FNFWGQLGNGNNCNQLIPLQVRAINREVVVAIACGHHQSLVLTKSGQVYAWGHNAFGQLGIACTDRFRNIPAKVRVTSEDLMVTKISCGQNHCLLLTSGGQMYAFGSNYYGQIGNDSKQDQFAPTRIGPPGAKFTDIACSLFSNTSAARGANKRAYIWGKCVDEKLWVPRETPVKTLEEVFARYNYVTFEPLVLNPHHLSRDRESVCLSVHTKRFVTTSRWNPVFICLSIGETISAKVVSRFDYNAYPDADSGVKNMMIDYCDHPSHYHYDYHPSYHPYHHHSGHHYPDYHYYHQPVVNMGSSVPKATDEEIGYSNEDIMRDTLDPTLSSSDILMRINRSKSTPKPTNSWWKPILIVSTSSYEEEYPEYSDYDRYNYRYDNPYGHNGHNGHNEHNGHYRQLVMNFKTPGINKLYADLLNPKLSVKQVNARLPAPVASRHKVSARSGGVCTTVRCNECLDSCKFLKTSKYSDLDITQYTYLRLCSEGCKDNLPCLQKSECLPVMKENPDFFITCANKCNLFQIIPQIFKTVDCPTH